MTDVEPPPDQTASAPIGSECIAPCGMNCALCSRYLSYLNGLSRSQCIGCRARAERCGYLFDKCGGVNADQRTDTAVFCYECDQYPCAQLERMDKRYRTGYGMSVLAHLEMIRERGQEAFIADQVEQYRCPTCDGLISVHNGKCFQCDTITRLVEKIGKR